MSIESQQIWEKKLLLGIYINNSRSLTAINA